ncbi:MAG: hypothetical protein KF773_42780 [Deltaproteobacteria bacterium]|nr:hypothetical protein [Deltaproteobacteria bacterium]MCW5808457.1 hypothetical protein [Deltaproteobacteria bacterium]
MRRKVATILLCSAALTSMAGCKKKGTGGGGGGWFVGAEGLMVNVHPDGQVGQPYDLGSDQTLNGIACRYLEEAYVVGAKGTVLHTSDAGRTWIAQDVGTTADLYALATQDAGPVFLGGDGVFMTAVPDFATGAATWRNLADATTSFRSIAAAQHASTVLAVSADGGVWAYEHDALVKRTTIPGARSVGVSPDGQMVLVAGAGLSLSLDGGATFRALEVDAGITFNDVGVDDERAGIAVGTNGAVARIDDEGRVLLQRIGTADLKTVRTAGSDWATAGFAGGADGQVLVTHDGGWTWQHGPRLGAAILGVDEIGDGHN